MKSSFSLKNLNINMESQQLITPPSSNFKKFNQTAKNAELGHRRNNSVSKINGIQSCKNGNRKDQQSFTFKKNYQDPTSRLEQQEQKIKKNNRKISVQDNCLNQQRRKQLDILCLQRLIGQIKKHFIQEKMVWNFQKLNYQSLIKLLWILKYVQHPSEETFISKNETEDLKKIYYFWLTISIKRLFSLVDFFIIVSIAQNIQYDIDYIDNNVNMMEKELCQMPVILREESFSDPKYIFFLKKVNYPRNSRGYLEIPNHEKEKISLLLKTFKLNKLKDCAIPIENPANEEDQTIIISKKSCELAETKRKKIVEEMKASNPKIQNIDLIDILSYRQRDYDKKIPASVLGNQKKRIFPQKNIKQIMKEIQVLSKPKPYSDQKTSDEISFEKNKEQYTFHPKVHNYRNKSRQRISKVKNVQKVVLRMREARQIKQQKQNILQKGWATKNIPKTFSRYKKNEDRKVHKEEAKQLQVQQKEQIQKQIKTDKQFGKEQKRETKRYEVSKEHLRIPLLYIDVNIEEGKKERIVIYDNDKASKLAIEFGEKHKLPSQTVLRLQQMLQQQIDSVLTRIDQQTDEQSSFLY